jgi:peptide/nickel transport system substrate-binding protein
MRKSMLTLVAIFMVATMVLSSCGPAATTVAPPPGTTAVPPTVAPPTVVPPLGPGAPLPRNETMYFNGQQWGSVVCWNPYSQNCNNALALNQQDSARVIMFETPYLYDMLDGQQYPLLADGPYAWNAARTEITFKIKAAAHWSDGTPVTAEDAAYTWATNLKYETGVGTGNKDFIDTVTAVDAQTVLVKAKLDANGKAVNPLVVAAYLSTNYILQKAWTQTLEARSADATALKADIAEDVIYSGPYHKFYADDQKVVYVRDDNYWGQDASMFGMLPVPKYLAHTIFKDNAAGSVALAQGEVDVSQQFNSNIQVLWAARLDLPSRGSLWHWRQPPDRLLQPEFLWFGPGCGPQGNCHRG